MAKATPVKLATILERELNEFADRLTHTGDVYSQVEFGRLMRDCEKLQRSDVVQGCLHRAFLYSTAGDLAEAGRMIKNAELNGGKDEARIGLFSHLANHGYASEALQLADQMFEHRAGKNLMELANLAAAIGAFSTIVKEVKTSKSKGEVLQMTYLYDVSQKASAVTQQLGVTDADVAAMLDVAGELLRANKLLWQNALPDLTVLDVEQGGPTLGISYRIGVAPEQAVEMGWALSERLVDRGLDRPGVYVNFLGTVLPLAGAA
jgi:hypothetical protein